MKRLFLGAIAVAALGLGACANGQTTGGTSSGGGGSTSDSASSTSQAASSSGSTSSSSTSSSSTSSSSTSSSSTSSSTSSSSTSSSSSGGSTAGDTCANAIALPGAGTYHYDSSADSDDFDDYADPCAVSAHGADMVFSISVGPGQILDVTQTPSGQNDAVLVLATMCPDPTATCIAYGDNGVEGDPESLTYTNTTSAAQTLFIVADNYNTGDTGPFDLTVKLHTPMCGDGVVDAPETCDDMNAVANDGCTACKTDNGYHCDGSPSVCVVQKQGDACGNPIAVAGSQTVSGTYTGFFNDYDPTDLGCTAYTEAGPDVVYKISLAAGQILDATLTPDATLMQDVGLYVLTDCTDPVNACPVGNDGGGSGDPENVKYKAVTAQTVYLVVDASDPTTTGAYGLDINIHAAPPGDTCANAIPVTGPMATLSGTYTGFYNDYDPTSAGCTGFGQAGADVVYAVTLAAGQAVAATLTPDATVMQDVGIYVLKGCTDPTTMCPAGADANFSGVAETVKYTAPSAQTVYLVVDGHATDIAGPYSLQVKLYTPVCGDGIIDAPEACDDHNGTANDGCTACKIDNGYHCAGEPSVCTAALTGDLCNKAIVIPAATATYMGTYDGFVNDYDPTDIGCTTFSEPGPDVAYSITLPAGKKLTATVLPDPVVQQDVAVYLVTDCADVVNSCLMGTDNGGGGMSETATYTTTAAQTIFIVVDTFDDTTTGKFTLNVTVM